MGGMKSGTGDVWDSDDDEEEAETETEEIQEQESDVSESADSGFPAGNDDEEDKPQNAISTRDRVPSEVADSETTETVETDEPTAATGDANSTTDDDTGREQPYIVRRMLKDKSVQYERDERLTLFVHDDVKNGEQELQATAQDRFGRDIPVFDIREAVYRAALDNPDDVLTELEEMGYKRD